MTLMKVPFLKRWLQRASKANLERKNPELASAIAKLERSGVQHDPQRAQAAMSRLSAAERRAGREGAGGEGAVPGAVNRPQRPPAGEPKKRRQRGGAPGGEGAVAEPMNRQQRRQAAKLKKRR